MAPATAQPVIPQSPYSKPAQVRPNLPGPAREELETESGTMPVLPPLLREGTFVSAARGQMIKGKSGRWFMVFDADATGRTLPPMVLMPSVNLTAMERMTEHTPAGTRMLVTGMVTAYRDLNYLLPTAPPLAVRADATAPIATPAPAGSAPTDPAMPSNPAPSTATPKGSEPSIDEIVKRLDKAISTAPGGGAAVPLRTSTAANGSPTPNGLAISAAPQTPPPLLSVGSIASRRGRITRGGDGGLVFTFDSGSSDVTPASSGPAATLILQPSQTLATIETLSERTGEGATYTISGEVTSYRDRNYLLVRSYKVNRVTDQVLPTQ